MKNSNRRSGDPNTGGITGKSSTFKVANYLPGKQGGKAKVGNPSGSMVQTRPFRGGGK